jgi:hypothetical protein
MKLWLVFAAILFSSTIAASKVVMNQLQSLESFYSNAGNYASQVTQPADVTTPPELKALSQPLKYSN